MRRCLGIAFVLSLLLAIPARAGGPASAYYAADTDGVFWFMHVSDLHIGTGMWETNYEPESLEFALNEGVEVIQPTFVVATGDLVDGSRSDAIPTSGQDQAEWDAYRSILTNAGMTATFYYDVIGNHDLYVPSWECPSIHWYLDNSLQGQATGAPHFSWSHTTALGDYFFHAIDMDGDCRGAVNPADTNGVLVDTEYNAIVAALDAHTDSQLVFVFGHQNPTEPDNAARLTDHLVEHGVFYVHGHAHEYREYLAGNGIGDIVVNEVNSLGKSNTDNIAVGVVDHNAFIYRATSHEAPWPFVILTAPVEMHLRGGSDLNPWAYDVCKDRMNPIRALVFAKETPAPVTVTLGSGAPINMTQVNGPLWKAVVDTSGLAAGQQTIKVTATAAGKTRTDEVGVNFVAGPCEPFQDDGGVPQQDAGGPQQDGGTGDDGGEVQEDGGEGDGGPPPPPPSDCGCRAAGAGAGPAWLGLLGLAGLALLVRRRGF